MGLPPEIDFETRQPLIENTLALLHENEIDFTRFFRSLKSLDPEGSTEENLRNWQQDPFFALPLGRENTLEQARSWLSQWQSVASSSGSPNLKNWVNTLEAVNPAMVPRNHLLQQAIEAAQKGDNEPLNLLLDALSDPYQVKPGSPQFYEQPPEWAKHIELSCSS